MARERIYDYPETEYSRAIARLGWSQVGAARLLGIDPRTSRRYIAGDLEMTKPLTYLLRVLVHLGRTDEWFESVAHTGTGDEETVRYPQPTKEQIQTSETLKRNLTLKRRKLTR